MRLLVVVLVLFCSVVSSPAAETAVTADQVVNRFLQRDLIGSRLTPEEWKTNIATLVGWKTEPDWAVLVVVESYRAKPVQRAPDGLRAVVEYRVLGELLDGQWIPRKKSPELQRVNFLLDRQDGRWQVKRPVQPPHISLATAIRQLEAAAGEFQQAGRQAMLQQSLQQLRTLRDAGS
ncbi:hypothetical protein C2E25_09235 [Geothermobacter hydrogeniphilus]|uniref:Uncharacterized protein n=1 Tax=Geothermobacter hydrogeniphilus TaxID=1969733 RepID=A0A2K2H9U1_9BACT|nr:hypothetical protein [Geothermobacter hydrogeniphilus]PNU20088.1 hypothetical protein C2E25_09235 [Geothermobacter hydrogeniphilus]